jgi:hypothetical protein
MSTFDAALYGAGLIAVLVIALVPLNSWYQSLPASERDKDDDRNIW